MTHYWSYFLGACVHLCTLMIMILYMDFYVFLCLMDHIFLLKMYLHVYVYVFFICVRDVSLRFD
jgi:hypothetical protein